MYPGKTYFHLATVVTLLLSSISLGISAQEMNSQYAPDGRPLFNSELPVKGMSQAELIRRFGEPVDRKVPVGKPPISIWDYENFRVFFEEKWVIHAVLKQQAPIQPYRPSQSQPLAVPDRPEIESPATPPLPSPTLIPVRPF